MDGQHERDAARQRRPGRGRAPRRRRRRRRAGDPAAAGRDRGGPEHGRAAARAHGAQTPAAVAPSGAGRGRTAASRRRETARRARRRRSARSGRRPAPAQHARPAAAVDRPILAGRSVRAVRHRVGPPRIRGWQTVRSSGAGRPGPRLPARRAGGRARLPGALRPVPGRRHLHRGLRRARAPRGASRTAPSSTSFLQRVHPDGAHVPGAAAALPVRDGGARPPRLRPRDLVELERLGPRRHRRRRGRPRLLLPQPVPLRLERARGDARQAATPRRAILGFVFQRWRQWDWIAAQRVDFYAANSETTRRRVKRYFGRDADVAAPAGRDHAFRPGRRRRRRLRRAVAS